MKKPPELLTPESLVKLMVSMLAALVPTEPLPRPVESASRFNSPAAMVIEPPPSKILPEVGAIMVVSVVVARRTSAVLLATIALPEALPRVMSPPLVRKIMSPVAVDIAPVELDATTMSSPSSSETNVRVPVPLATNDVIVATPAVVVEMLASL